MTRKINRLWASSPVEPHLLSGVLSYFSLINLFAWPAGREGRQIGYGSQSYYPEHTQSHRISRLGRQDHSLQIIQGSQPCTYGLHSGFHRPFLYTYIHMCITYIIHYIHILCTCIYYTLTHTLYYVLYTLCTCICYIHTLYTSICCLHTYIHNHI